jgi:Conjugative transposon protein TcpC
VAHLSFGTAARRLNGESGTRSRKASPATTMSLLARLGRALLWFVLALLLVRGAADVLGPSAGAAAGQGSPARGVAWPDDEARAFAVEFARVYLSYSPQKPRLYADAARAMVAPELADAVAPEFDENARTRVVGAATVARTVRLDARRALITVAAGDERYLTVPVAQDEEGGLAVYDLPSFAPPPARGAVAVAPLDALSGPEREAIRDVLERFFGAFLAGDTRALTYFVPAGVPMAALGRRHELVDVVSLSPSGPERGRARDVLATVRARDVASRAVYALRYRLRLVRGDRWLVAEVNNATRKEG